MRRRRCWITTFYSENRQTNVAGRTEQWNFRREWIYLLYTLLGQGIMKQFAASEDYVYQIYTVDLPEAFSYLKTESDLEVTEITVEKESDVLEKIEAEEADL